MSGSEHETSGGRCDRVAAAAEAGAADVMIRKSADVSGVAARLSDAVARGDRFELILVVRGKVRPGVRPGRWRIRLDGGHVLSFDADAVLAATPLPRSTGARR